MIPTEPLVASTGRYSISQTAQALGLHRNTIRRLTDEGQLKCGFRRGTYRRFYIGSEILRFWKQQM